MPEGTWLGALICGTDDWLKRLNELRDSVREAPDEETLVESAVPVNKGRRELSEMLEVAELLRRRVAPIPEVSKSSIDW